ncbi:pilin [Acinetobacter sp. LF10]|uniref:pilin n=1 Tax=Acinetobacter sp. LF10 TaxID=3403576 RepID=UPI003B210D50
MRLPFRKLWVAPIPTALLVFALLNQCSDNSHIFTALVISSIFLSAWTTQYSIAEGKCRSKWYEYPFSILYDGCFLIVIAAISLVFIPPYQCYNDRTKVSEALSSIAQLRSEISNSLIAKKEITQKELDNPSSFKNIAYLEVDRTGKILIITATPSVSIRLVPEYKDGAIEWQCHGRPEKFVPANCRR